VAKKDLMTFLTWKKEIKEALEKLHNEEELPYQPYKLIDKLIKDMPQKGLNATSDAKKLALSEKLTKILYKEEEEEIETKDYALFEPLLKVYKKQDKASLLKKIKNNLSKAGFLLDKDIEEYLLREQPSIGLNTIKENEYELAFRTKLKVQSTSRYNFQRKYVYLQLSRYERIKDPEIREKVGNDVDRYRKRWDAKVNNMEEITMPTNNLRKKKVRFRIKAASYQSPSSQTVEGTEIEIINPTSGHWVSVAEKDGKYLYFDDSNTPTESDDFMKKSKELRSQGLYPILLIYERIPEDDE
ncbi:MAG: hypothetical protein AAF335_04585, partial [Bacteroidota bacterium]